MAEQQTNVPAPTNVAVLGGGSFGTALASIAADNGARVRQWMRDETLVTQIPQRPFAALCKRRKRG